MVVNNANNTLGVFLGNGDGTFKAPTFIATGHAPSSIAAADFNNDGHIDLAVTNQNDNTVSVFIGNGDGTFRSRADYAVGTAPVWVSTGDFSGDGFPDLAVANNTCAVDVRASGASHEGVAEAPPLARRVGHRAHAGDRRGCVGLF